LSDYLEGESHAQEFCDCFGYLRGVFR